MTPLVFGAVQGAANHVLVVAILIGAVTGGTSILYAALGETISERAGVVNVGTEGAMLAGALASFAATVKTGHVWKFEVEDHAVEVFILQFAERFLPGSDCGRVDVAIPN